MSFPGVVTGAGNEARTRDLNLGKVALYQLSYSRNMPQLYTRKMHFPGRVFNRA